MTRPRPRMAARLRRPMLDPTAARLSWPEGDARNDAQRLPGRRWAGGPGRGREEQYPTGDG